MTLSLAERDVVIVTDADESSLQSSFRKKLSALNPQRRVATTPSHECASIDAAVVLVWLAKSAPPRQIFQDAARVVLACVVGDAYATFESGLLVWAQMGRGFSCALAVVDLTRSPPMRRGLERRIKVLRHVGPRQAHDAAVAAAVVVHQWLLEREGPVTTVAPVRHGGAWTLGALVLRFAVTALALAGRLAYGAFFAQRWRVGHLRNASIDGIAARVSDIEWWPELGRGQFLADPFIELESPLVLLCEWKRPEKGRGVIARVQLDEVQKSLEVVEILDCVDAHLSYPNTVEHEGTTLLFPECAQSGVLTMYALDERGRPRLPGTRLLDQPLIDATLLRHDGMWWLFGTLPGAAQSESHLHLFYSRDLGAGSWKSHRMNPVVIDPACARPAGRILEVNGRLVRPAQDCERRYGNAIRFMEISVLSTERYEERLASRLGPPPSGFPKHGIHTFNMVGSTAILDGYTIRFDPLAWFDRLMERSRFRNAFGRLSGNRS